MMRLIAVCGLGFAYGIGGCASMRQTEYHEAKTLAVLASYLTGSFSSQAQSEADPDNYFDIRLHAVPIWEWATEGAYVFERTY